MPKLTSRAGVAACVTACAALALAGCAKNDAPPSNTTVVAPGSSAPPVVATTPGTVTPGTVPPGAPGNAATKVNVNAGPGASTGTDTATAKAVNDAIVTNKQMTGSRIEAVVTGGVCTLTGITQNSSQKGIAEQTARRTAGVTNVKNKIEIRPTGGAGRTAAVKPTTKVIVVHQAAPAPPASPMPPAPPAPPAMASGSHMSGGTMKGHKTTTKTHGTTPGTTGTPTDASGTDSTTDTTTTDTTTTTTGNGQ